MADDTDTEQASQNEVLKQHAQEADKIRQILADVYTFVRSREINKQIASYTMDHYIDQARLRIKGEGLALTDASGKTQDSAGRAYGTRPTQLAALTSLESTFNSGFEEMKKLAQALDSDAEDKGNV